MKIIQFSAQGGRKLGLVTDAGITILTGRIPNFPVDMVDLIEQWDELRSVVQDVEKTADFQIGDVTVLPPIARPGKILGIGLNYADHIAESNSTKPEYQTWFSKAVTSINGPFDPIQRPSVSVTLDYEAELVIVIGKRCKHVSVEDAASAIFGYTVGNDVSVRDWQLRTPQHVIGKSFDTHAPIGPWLVTADEVDPGNLSIKSFVNEELRQNSCTKYLIFNCLEQISYLSQAMTLEPGDLLFTGTPGGVGGAMTPPCWLKAGDRVRVEIGSIGAIDNPVVEEQLDQRAGAK